MDEQEIADHLYSVAQQTAAQSGRHLGDGADADLRHMTQHAAAELAKISDLNIRGAEVNRVAADVARLIQMALEEAKLLINYPADLLGEQSFFPAKMRFCPCPPLC